MLDRPGRWLFYLWAACLCACGSTGPAPPSTSPVPPIPLGYDAYRRWDLWPRLRLGQRTYMRSTFDRMGGNEGSDCCHFLRLDDATHNVTVDVTGSGVLSFVRTNHWHGSPWHYITDGDEHVVTESTTADPNHPVMGSTFQPGDVFAPPLALTWSTTNGADLSWVPVPFTQSFELAYERTFYGTGYYIYSLLAEPGDAMTPIATFDPQPPPGDVVDLLDHAGEDQAPAGDALGGSVALAPGTTTPLGTPVGPAQIRAIVFDVAEPEAAAFGDARLRITWDGEPAPSVDAPVALLFGTGSLYNRSGREWLVKSLPVSIHFSGGRVTFAMYFPMPYSSSATVELVGAEAVSQVDWQIRTEPYLDPPTWSGRFHATYVDHGVPVAGKDLVLLDTTQTEGGGDWCGHFVGTSFIFSDTAWLGTLEGDPRFFFDDSESPQAQGTGTEEWAGGGDYWGGQTMTLPLVGHPVGASSAATSTGPDDLIESAYRFLLADVMPFGRNARIQLEHGGVDDSTEHYRSVAFWYARRGACLTLTDTLHVSDPDDEAAHGYLSPTASDPETLSSRFEVGVDHVGAVEVVPESADTGRHMTDTTELRVAIDPSNLGVLLRRKLDLMYADQRAEVLVADDVDGAPFVSAGTWYTAGSNQVIYSFPPGETDPAAPMLETSTRRWREDEFLLPRTLTRGRSAIRLRIVFQPGAHPLQPGAMPPPSAWSEYRYSVYSFVEPR
jgi:hypothetical protein